MYIDNTLIVPNSLPLKNPGLDRKQLIQFIGKDGRDYGTPKALQEANRDYFARIHPSKVHDAIESRREIPSGAGEVQVCVGFLKGRDEYGMRTETPLYRTETF